MLENVVKSKYDTYNDLDEFLYKAREYLDSDVIKKHFSYNTFKEMLEYLFNARGTYKIGARVSGIKSELRDFKSEIRQMSAGEINNRIPDVIVNLAEKIFNVNEQQQDIFYTTRSDTSDFGTREIFENEEETLKDMPEWESEGSAAKKKKSMNKRIKNINFTTNA